MQQRIVALFLKFGYNAEMRLFSGLGSLFWDLRSIQLTVDNLFVGVQEIAMIRGSPCMPSVYRYLGELP